MIQVLAVLAAVSTTLCHHHGWGGMFWRQWGHFHHSPAHHLMNPPPPYLHDVSERAAEEYYETVNNMGMTLDQQKEAVRQWADRHKILDEVQKFNIRMEDRKSELKVKVAKLARDLPDALEKFWSIVENRTNTPLDQRYALEKLSYENPPLYNVMSFAIEQFLPLSGPYEEQSRQRRFHGYYSDEYFRRIPYYARSYDRFSKRHIN